MILIVKILLLKLMWLLFKLIKKNTRKRNKYENDSVKLLEWNKEISKETFKKLLKQLESGILDFGLFIRDYDHNLYEGIPLKSTNSLGILVFKNHPFASKKDNQSKWSQRRKNNGS